MWIVTLSALKIHVPFFATFSLLGLWVQCQIGCVRGVNVFGVSLNFTFIFSHVFRSTCFICYAFQYFLQSIVLLQPIILKAGVLGESKSDLDFVYLRGHAACV